MKETKVIHANSSRGSSSSKQQTKQCVRQTTHSHSHGTHFILMYAYPIRTYKRTHINVSRFVQPFMVCCVYSFLCCFFCQSFPFTRAHALSLALHRYRIYTICHYFTAADEAVAANTIHVCRNPPVRPFVRRQALRLLLNFHCKFLSIYERKKNKQTHIKIVAMLKQLLLNFGK